MQFLGLNRVVSRLSGFFCLMVAFVLGGALLPYSASADDNTYVYDANGRVTGVVYSSGATAIYSYDADGNLTSIITPAAGAIAVAGFAPQSGATGTTVTVFGQGFSTTPTNNVAKFNGVAATVSAATTNQLIVTVPGGASTGAVSVTVAGSTATSSASFTVLNNLLPSISSFSPLVGIVGTAVTVNGAHFASSYTEEHAYFNGASAPVASSSTSTQIGATVPAGGSSGPISVSTQYGTGTSSQNFVVLPASGLPSGVSASTISEVAQTTVGGAAASYPISVASTQAVITFKVAAGVTAITAAITASSFSSGASVYLYGPTNQLVTSGSYTTVPAYFYAATMNPGTYLLLVVPAAGATGSATVQILNATSVAGAVIAGGASVQLTDTVPGQQLMWTFSGTAGQQISVEVNSFTGLSGNSYLYLYDQQNHMYGNTWLSNGSLLNNDYGPFTLNLTGTYTLVLVPSGPATGTATLQVLTMLAPVTGTVTVGGPAVQLTDTAPGQQFVWTFAGTAGQQVSIELNSYSGLSGNSYLYLYDQQGRSYGNTWISNGSLLGNAFGPFTLSVTGTYTILLVPAGLATGSASVQVLGMLPPVSGTVTVGGPAVQLTDTAPGQQLVWTFQGLAGQQISVDLNGYTGLSGNSYLYLYDQQDRLYGNTWISNGSLLNNAYGPFTLGVTGTYTLVLVPAGLATGSATLQVLGMAAPVTAMVTVGGPSVQLTDTATGQQLVWTFPGTAGQQISVELNGYTGLSGNSYLYLYDQQGHLYGNTWISNGSLLNNAYGPFTLKMTGTYTLVLIPAGLATGSATLQVLNMLPPPVTGALTVGGGAVQLTDSSPGQQLVWTFQGTVGQQVSIEVASYAGLSGNSYLYLYDQQDHLYGSTWISNGSLLANAYGPFTLNMTGTYTLVLVPSGTAVGSATVQVLSMLPPVTTTTTVGGSAIQLTNTAPSQQLVWTFQGTAGQQIGVELNSYTGLSGNSYLYLYDQQDHLYGSTWISNGSLLSNVYGPFTLNMAGTYTLVLAPAGLTTGSATLQVLSMLPAVTAAVTAGGAAVQLSDTAPGQQLVWTFAGTAGQQVSVELTGYSGLSGNSYLYLYDQQDHLYGNTWISNGSLLGNAYGPFTLNVTGTYTLVLVPSGLATGSATLQVLNEVPVTNTAVIGGTPVQLADTVPGQTLLWTFQGTAGQGVTVAVNAFSGLSGNAYLYLYDQFGHLYGNKTLGSMSNGTSSTTPLGPFTLNVTGPYTVVLVPSGLGVGSATVQITSATGGTGSNIVTGTMAVSGAAVPLTDTIAGQQLAWTFQGTAGQQVSVELTSYTGLAGGSTLYLYDQQGHLYGNNNLQWISNGSIATSALGPYMLPGTGSYTVLLVPSGTATGTATVQAFSVPQSATGTMSVGGAAVPLTDTVSGQQLVWTFPGTAGQQVSVELTGYSGLAGGSTLYLFDARGHLYGNNNLQWISTGTAATAALGPFTLPLTETYTVVLWPSGLATGTASVQIISLPPSANATLTVGGAAVPLTDTVSGQQLVWTFQGMAGQQVSVELTSYAGLAGGSTLYVYDQQSHLYGNNNLQWISNGIVATAALGPYTLPQTGTYTVVLVPSGLPTGSATVQVFSVPQSVTGTLMVGGAAVQLADTVSGQQLIWTFQGTAGQQVSLSLNGYSGLAGGSSLYLYDQQGRLYGNNNLQWISNGSISTTPLGPYMLPQTSTYTVVLVPSGLATGNATVQVFSVPQSVTGTLMVGGAAVQLTSTVSGEQLAWTFQGTAGQQISVELTGYVGLAGGSSLYLYDQLGHLYGNNNLQWISNGSVATAALGPYTLPQPGTYTVVLLPSGTATGSATVQVVNVPQAVTGSLTVGGAAVPLSDTGPGQQLVWTFQGTAGQQISVEVTSYSGLAGGSSLYLYDQQGHLYGNNNLQWICNGSTAVAALGPYMLAQSGTYTALLLPSGLPTGTATVRVFSVPQSATGSLTLGGAAVSLANTVSGQQLVWTFHGTVGQQINIALNGYTGLAGGSSLYLYDQQGHLYGNNNLQWISNGSAATAPLGPFTLAQTGIYTIVLAPSGLATGNANVQLLNATPVKGSLTVGGAALTLTDVAPWQPLVWTFSGNLAQRVTIWIPSYSGLSAGSGVNFYDQRGRVYLANAPLSGLVNRSAGTYTLDANATYTLKLVPIGTAIGSAMVQVSP